VRLQPRARVATELLLEMNEYVKGDWLQEDIVALLRNNPDVLKPFTTVIAVNQDGSTVDILAKALWECNTPLLIAKAYGNVGCIQIVAKEHCVVEYHVDSKLVLESIVPPGTTPRPPCQA
jgi:molybdopterin/thiamine biosynthesis adenylyltransferase